MARTKQTARVAALGERETREAMARRRNEELRREEEERKRERYNRPTFEHALEHINWLTERHKEIVADSMDSPFELEMDEVEHVISVIALTVKMNKIDINEIINYLPNNNDL